MEPTTIFANTGDGDETYELASFYDQNREPVDYDEVSPYVYDALLSTEDPRFYEHGGVDLIGTGRALLSNAVSDTTQGGSSISQQYVKGVQLQTCERTSKDADELAECAKAAAGAHGVEGYQRKLQEMRYAITIEQEYSKEQILVGYLNLVNFGGSTYGIEAAAQRYFNTTAKKLTLSQAATLVGMANNPNVLRLDFPDSETNGEANGYAAARDRRDQVLGRMLTEGTISKKQHDAAVAEDIVPDITDRVKGCSAAGASAYFCQYVTNTVLHDPRYDETFGKIDGGDNSARQNVLHRGGLKIYTTLDNSLQYSAQQAMAANTSPYLQSMRFGATSVQLDTKTGNILTLAQNTLFDDIGDPLQGKTPLIFAADYMHGSSNGFNAGSTYKIFTISDWLKQGRSVNELLDGRAGRTFPMSCHGTPTSSVTPTSADNFNGNPGLYSTVRKFTELSLNTGFYAMGSQLDVCDIHDVAADMGLKLGSGDPINDPTDNSYFTLIGSKAVAPLDMAAIYATVANGGVRCEPTAILRVVGADGKDLKVPETPCERKLDANIAATVAYDMEAVMDGPQGSGAAARVGDGIQTFGKTGTHQSIQSWMIQSSTNVTTAVWAGNYSAVFEEDPDFDGSKIAQYDKNLSYSVPNLNNYRDDLFNRGLANIRYSLSKANQAAANAKFGGENFPDPDEALVKVTKHPVPNVQGMSVDQATQTLQDRGFQVRVDPNPVPGDQSEGLVEWTNPSGEAPAGSLISLQISNGKGSVKVPNVKGLNLAKASDAVWDANLSLQLSCKKKKDAPAEGRVTSISPEAGTYVHRDADVRVTYEAESCKR